MSARLRGRVSMQRSASGRRLMPTFRGFLCRHIDCAKAYQNQTGLGQALQDLYKEGKVSRKDFWLTTKLWNTDHAEVRKNCLESMKELQTDYLDLYLVHWPVTPHKGPELTPSMKVCSHP